MCTLPSIKSSDTKNGIPSSAAAEKYLTFNSKSLYPLAVQISEKLSTASVTRTALCVAIKPD